jgi:cupin fold WbuC family metalloprotein
LRDLARLPQVLTNTMSVESRFRHVTPEVFQANAGTTTFSRSDIAVLKAAALNTDRRRARFCAHADADASLHEMLIVHPRDAYVRPHLHRGKDESLVVLEGEVLLVLFDAHGLPSAAHRLAAAGSSDRPFFLRTPADTYHTLLIQSEWLTFLEATTGPFDRADTIFAPWSPADADVMAVQNYRNELLAEAFALAGA